MENELTVKALSDSYIKRYKQSVIMLFVVLILLVILAFAAYKRVGNKIICYSPGTILECTLYMQLAHIVLDSRFITVNGLNLVVTFMEDKIVLKDRFMEQDITKTFAWNEIEKIVILRRRIEFNVDTRRYNELLSKYRKRRLFKKHRAELLDCYFSMEYNEQVLKLVETRGVRIERFGP